MASNGTYGNGSHYINGCNGSANGNGHHHPSNGTNGHNHAIQPGSILCLGNALLDVSFFADAAFLAEHGLGQNDACLLDQKRYETIHKALLDKYKTEDHVPGGASQNTARTAAWLLADHPGTVTYLGSISNDSIGDILQQKVKEAGVTGIYQNQTDGTPTGCCLVILSDHHRSLAAFLGAALKFTADHVRDNWKAIERARYAYIEGFFLSTCLEACLLVAQHMAEHNDKRFMLNLSAEFVTTFHKHMLLEIMPYVDVLFGNDSEFLSFGKEMNFGTDLVEIVKKVAGMEKKRNNPCRIVVATCGGNPVIIAVGPNEVITSPVSKVPAEKIVDTNGAGDAFVGGFLAQLVRGRSLEQCVRSGSNTATIVIQRLGCTFPAEKLDLEELCK